MDEEHKDAPPNDLAEQLAAMERERDEYRAGWQRAKADFINYKKEEVKNLEEVARYGSESLIKELLSVLHTFDLALNLMKKNGHEGDVAKGIKLIRSQIEDILKRRGVEKIAISPGDPFDPMIAEGMVEVESEYPPGSVVEVMEPGYRLHEKVLRAAKVSVSKEKE